jgi:hypothetical protein
MFSANLRIGKTKSIAIGIDQTHLSHSPWRIFGRLQNLHTTRGDLAIERINIVNDDVSRSTHLTVPGMLREKEGQPITGDLRKHWEARLEPMFPVRAKAQALLVEGPRALPVRHSQLRCYTLRHGVVQVAIDKAQAQPWRRAWLATMMSDLA